MHTADAAHKWLIAMLLSVFAQLLADLDLACLSVKMLDGLDY